MTTEKTDKRIPIAYVTRWATTTGILVVHDGEVSEGAYLHQDHLWVASADWTVDRDIAESRWREALLKAARSAEAKADRLRTAVTFSPKYTER